MKINCCVIVYGFDFSKFSLHTIIFEKMLLREVNMIINVKSVWLDMFARLYIEMVVFFSIRHVDVKRICSLDSLTNKTRETSTQKISLHPYV